MTFDWQPPDRIRTEIEAMEQQKPVGMLHAGSYYGEELEDWEFEANQGACDKLGAPKSCPNDDARCNRLLAATPEVGGNDGHTRAAHATQEKGIEMIDINELRRKLRSDDLMDHVDIHANVKPVLTEILDRLEAAEKERDNYKFALSEYSEKTEWVQQGINDGTVSAKYLGWHRADIMSDLLSAAEKKRDALRAEVETTENDAAHQKALAASALRVAKGWERKCDALRARIKEMEKQEPVAWCATDETGTVVEALGMNQSRRFDTALYLARGAQPAPSVPDGWKEAAIAWEVCASIHREYGKGKDPFFNTRQGDFVKHANDARAMLAGAPEAKP